MFLSKLKLIGAAVLAVAVLGGGIAYHGLAVEPPARDDKKAKDDKEVILGTWKVNAFEEEGKDVLDTDEGKKIKEGTVTITGDKIVNKSGEDLRELTYRLNPAAKPKAIDIDNGKGKTLKGVYSLDGNTLKICWPIDPDGDRPAEVASKEGSKSKLLVLKREAKDR